jgi:glycosyltransferase involved in cell wall biosynthesis
MNDLKTIHLTKTIGPNSYGVGQVALNLPKAQDEMGIDVELWSVDSESVAQDAALAVGLDKSVCRSFPQSWPGFLHYSREMEKEARLLRVETGQAIIIHQHMIWLLYSRTVLILRERGAKVVIAPHGALDDWALAKSSWKKKLAYRLWEGNNLHGAHCLQATSEREVQNFRDYGLKNPIARINNGVSQEQLESRGDGSRFRDRHGISQDRRLMLFIARISRQKGLPMLLSAMNALRSKLDDWTLIVGGADQDGHEQEVKDALSIGMQSAIPFKRFEGFGSPVLWDYLTQKLGPISQYAEIGCPLWGLLRHAKLQQVSVSFFTRSEPNYWGDACQRNGEQCASFLHREHQIPLSSWVDKMPDEKQQLIGFFQYLDHLDHPIEFLDEVFSRFQHAAVILDQVDEPVYIQHLTGFSTKTMQYLAESYGKHLHTDFQAIRPSANILYLFTDATH